MKPKFKVRNHVWIKDCERRSLIGTRADVDEVISIGGIEHYGLKKGREHIPGYFKEEQLAMSKVSIPNKFNVDDIVKDRFSHHASPGKIIDIIGTDEDINFPGSGRQVPLYRVCRIGPDGKPFTRDISECYLEHCSDWDIASGLSDFERLNQH